MKYTSKKSIWIILSILFLLLISFSTFAGTEAVSQDKEKAAVVNGTVITRKEFDIELNQVKIKISQGRQAVSDAKLEKIKNDILENLINRELLYQQSQKKGVVIEEKIVEDYLSSLKQKFPNQEEYEKALKDFSISENGLKLKVKMGYAIQNFIDKQIADKVAVSEKESKTFYDVHPEFFKQPERVKASHILIKLDPNAEESKKASAKEKIENIQKKLKEGKDFTALAREFSEGPSKDNGGDLGFFTRGQMVPPFEDAAFSLKTGEVSDLVVTRFGYHLIKVTEKAAAQTIKFEDAKEKIVQHLKQEGTKKELQLYIENLRKTASIEKFL